jgi:hypothetical protein
MTKRTKQNSGRGDFEISERETKICVDGGFIWGHRSVEKVGFGVVNA